MNWRRSGSGSRDPWCEASNLDDAVSPFESRARLAHLFARAVAAVSSDGIGRVLDNDRLEPFAACAQDRRADANVLCQSTYPDAADILFPQFCGQACFVERRILIAIESNALGHDNG